MTLNAGFRLGPYEIVSPLGAGGMGEVYRARDARLGRDVAVKALPASAIGDPERMARFEREAQILAGLSHPHIAALYGLEESSSSKFLIMELVEGGTLAERLKPGPLAARDAMTIARQIADALQAAHDRGIIHRDLKPANVAFTADGHVKVLDFGLAKAYAATADAPTAAPGGTQSGVVLGTAAYMSPEQARGLPLDKRTDIFSFGCVLYEMLTGRNPFAAENVSDIIVAILGREPDWTLLPAAVPPRVQWLLRRCLEKDPRRRLHDIADARIELDEALTQPGDSGPVAASLSSGTAPGASMGSRLPWLVVAVSIAGLIAAVAYRGRPIPATDDSSAPVYRSSIVLAPRVHLSGMDAAGFALSPDGRTLAFVGSEGDGPPMVWVRPLDGLIAQPLAGTEGARLPFWSADSRFIGYIARPTDAFSSVRGRLTKVGIAGGQPVGLVDVGIASAAAWNRDNVILFTPAGNSALHRVPASGGAATPVTSLATAKGEVQHSSPHFLPDGRHFLYGTIGSSTGGVSDIRSVYVGALDSREPARMVVERGSHPRYANGHLIFVRGGALMVQAFDPERLEVQGEAVALVDRVGTSGSGGGASAAFSLSATGVLAYQTGSSTRSQLVWFDRQGTRIADVGEAADQVDVVLSPDAARAAVSVLDPLLGTRDIWVFDLARGFRERVTSNRSDEFAPVWSPKGDRLVFSAVRDGSVELYEQIPGGLEQRMDAGAPGLGKYGASWSPDGRQILYIGGGGIIARSDLMLLPVEGERKPRAFLDSQFIETQARFSPDGRWVAYVTNDSNRLEAYVRPFPGPGSAQRVSGTGGRWPLWKRDGTELFFIAPDDTVMAAPVGSKADTIEVRDPRPLFKTRFRPMNRLDAYPYDVALDGQRFLINTFLDEPGAAAPITLVVNWPAGLKK